MPGDEVVENRSCLWFLRTDTQALDAFFPKKYARHRKIGWSLGHLC